MLDGNNPADAGTANADLSLDEAVERHTHPGEPAQPSEQEQAEGDTQAQAEETPETPEEQEPDTTPDWDKTDDPVGGDEEPATDAGRYASHKAKVKLPDGSEVSVHDLVQGNLRQQDYTRKTQEVAAERARFTQGFAQLQQLEQHLANERQMVEAFVSSVVPQDWTQEQINADPIGYIQAKAAREQVLNYVQQMRQVQAQNAQQLEYQRRQLEAQSEQVEFQRLFQVMPQLNDPQKRQAFADDMLKTAVSYGFTPDEVRSYLRDHRQFQVLADAARWQRTMTSKSAAKNKAVTQAQAQRAPVTKPGKRVATDAGKSAAVKSWTEQLKRTGSLEAATELIMARRGA